MGVAPHIAVNFGVTITPSFSFCVVVFCSVITRTVFNVTVLEAIAAASGWVATMLTLVGLRLLILRIAGLLIGVSPQLPFSAPLVFLVIFECVVADRGRIKPEPDFARLGSLGGPTREQRSAHGQGQCVQ